MKTKIKSIHEERYSDNSRLIGVLFNESIEDNTYETFVYVYRNEIYIFFDTIVDMIDYLLYADSKVKRAYMKEEMFDELYDKTIDGKFNSFLDWIEKEKK